MPHLARFLGFLLFAEQALHIDIYWFSRHSIVHWVPAPDFGCVHLAVRLPDLVKMQCEDEGQASHGLKSVVAKQSLLACWSAQRQHVISRSSKLLGDLRAF